MKIETYTYDLIDSKMYVLIEESSALIIDPCISEKAKKSIKDKKIRDIKIVLTHEHYDHISGIEFFRNLIDNCEVICSEQCHINMQSPLKNGSKYFKAIFLCKDEALLSEAEKIQPVSYSGDLFFNVMMSFEWHGHTVELQETPGHSLGSICIKLDNKCLFTGDSLLKNATVITKLPGGSKEQYNKITVPYLKGLDEDLYVYPGHGEGGVLSEFVIVDA